MITVYPFEMFQVDDYHRSTRWATRERIEELNGTARIAGEGVQVDEDLVGKEIPGMTAKHFDPRLWWT